ncbi:unnamed protein product [Cuscuta epithymum]|uniref:Uncharacterized protein n=1 Tax=Cuscuta epithymum TaxID=186058 RepID=A0AAV0CF13_9ASTE|nr:unnamed protein product [Cuscuta epithymum]
MRNGRFNTKGSYQPKRGWKVSSQDTINNFRQYKDGFDFYIKSKRFCFNIIDCNAIRISETKHGITSKIVLDLERMNWLNDSIPKLLSGICSKNLELKNSIYILYNANFFGGFVRIIEKGRNSLFIPEGRNGRGILHFMAGIAKAINLMKVKVAAPILNVEQVVGELSHASTNEQNLLTQLWSEDHSCSTSFSISRTLLQVDIDNSLEMTPIKDTNSSEQTPSHDASLENLKDFFQNIMTNGVDSLSQFLLKEFERILATSLGNQNMGHKEEGAAIRYANPEINIARDVFAGYQLSSEGEGVYSDPFLTYSSDEFLGHVSENEKRAPISTMEDLWDSNANQEICDKALLVTRENCLPTENLNTQIKTYRKKNQRSHLMRTRSQTRADLNA